MEIDGPWLTQTTNRKSSFTLIFYAPEFVVCIKREGQVDVTFRNKLGRRRVPCCTIRVRIVDLFFSLQHCPVAQGPRIFVQIDFGYSKFLGCRVLLWSEWNLRVPNNIRHQMVDFHSWWRDRYPLAIFRFKPVQILIAAIFTNWRRNL